MPVLAFCEERFHPYTALTECFLVGLGRLIGTHTIQVLLIHTPAQTASLLIGGTLGLQWARITVLDIGTIAALSLSRLPLHKVQFFACGADVDIARRLIPEAVWAKECGTMVVIWKGNVGVDVFPFNGRNVFLRAVLAITRHLPGPQLPTKAHPPKEVQHWLVVHDLRGGHQHHQDDAGFAAIHDIVGVVTHIRSVLSQHEGGIWIGGTHTQISHALIAATRDTPVLCSSLLDPIMTLFIVLGECCLFLLGE